MQVVDVSTASTIQCTTKWGPVPSTQLLRGSPEGGIGIPPPRWWGMPTSSSSALVTGTTPTHRCSDPHVTASSRPSGAAKSPNMLYPRRSPSFRRPIPHPQIGHPSPPHCRQHPPPASGRHLERVCGLDSPWGVCHWTPTTTPPGTTTPYPPWLHTVHLGQSLIYPQQSLLQAHYHRHLATRQPYFCLTWHHC